MFGRRDGLVICDAQLDHWEMSIAVERGDLKAAMKVYERVCSSCWQEELADLGSGFVYIYLSLHELGR